MRRPVTARFRFVPTPPRDRGGAWLLIPALALALLALPVGGFTGFLGRLALGLAAVGLGSRLIPRPEPRKREVSIRVSAEGLWGVREEEVLVGWDALGAARWRDDGLEFEHGPFLPLSGLVEGSIDDLHRLFGPPPPRDPRPTRRGGDEWSAPGTNVGTGTDPSR